MTARCNSRRGPNKLGPHDLRSCRRERVPRVAPVLSFSPIMRCDATSESLHGQSVLDSGIATDWTGVDMPTPLVLEVAPEIDTNPTSFYRGEG